MFRRSVIHGLVNKRDDNEYRVHGVMIMNNGYQD